ncbi:CheR family methyltransferase, partial [Thiocapsa sp.]|uniref:CheR family methyltransferase n=1 Tax=Thiocapsa sp. TaxID=2024551 RepID=UPI003593C119
MHDNAVSSPKVAIVGIGASAGGLAILKRFFACTSADSGLAYVVIMHLAPDHPSVLADLLQPHVAMPVQQVTEDVVVEANQVYVIPPGRNLSTIDSHLRLSLLEVRRAERAPIDHFFDTLSQSHREHCVAVVLSGTGSDGSIGISMVKERGGLTIAQEPSEAEFEGMPRNAIATGLVDLVLPVPEMPERILQFIRTTPSVEVADDLTQHAHHDPQVLQHVFAQVRARTGQDFSRYKPSTVLRRIRRRMQLNHTEDLYDYLERLRQHPAEVLQLADDLLITVTQFFRDSAIYAHIEENVIPRLFEGKDSGNTIRVWSVGCATGEEAYSLAMLLREHADGLETPPKLEVFASDVHEGALVRAREGVYPDTIEGYMPESRLRRFFSKEEGCYRIKGELRELLVFANHNLLKDPPFSRQDLIVCRNLLIYMQQETQQKVIELFHYALNPGGLLWLGSAETLGRVGLFEPESKQNVVYRRRDVPRTDLALPVFSRPQRTPALTGHRRPPESPTSYGGLHQRMVERFALPSILVDQDLRLAHTSEHAGRYLRVPGGEMSSDVLKLVRDELGAELQSALYRATERGQPQRTAPIPLTLDGEPRLVVVHVRPSQDDTLGGLHLVIFDEMPPPVQASGEPALIGSDEDTAELELTKQRLRSVRAQNDASREEMKAANQELQSANEELRSTMEELETSKEELQSMNEELHTVNQENRHKVAELSQLTADLNNLMAASEIATLFLDQDLRIVRVTPRAGELFNILVRDRGRPLTDLRRLVAYEQLEEDARNVLETLEPVQREVQGQHGTWFLTRVLPYRSTSDEIQGIVITLVDITEHKHAELALRDSEARFRALVEASAQIVWTTDAAGQVIDESPSWRAFTGQSETARRTDGWFEAVHPAEQDFARKTWRRCIQDQQPLDVELRLQHVNGDWRWTQARAVPLRGPDGYVRGWVGMNTDITARKTAEAKLLAEDRLKDEFLATLGHELRNPLAPIRTAIDLFKQRLPQDTEFQQLCSIQERQLEHLCRLVDDLLDVARIKSGRIHLRQEPLDLRASVNAAIDNTHAAITAQTQVLTVQQSKDPLPVNGDTVRLVQAVTNLLHNASKFTPMGGRIGVQTRLTDRHAEVRVRDSGIGIAPKMHDQIFEPFIQGSGSDEKVKDGLGLGLAIASRIMTLHAGTIEVHSEGLGKGSEFTLRLPLSDDARVEGERESAHAREGAAAEVPAATHAERSSVARRILVVD